MILLLIVLIFLLILKEYPLNQYTVPQIQQTIYTNNLFGCPLLTFIKNRKLPHFKHKKFGLVAVSGKMRAPRFERGS